MGNFEKIFPILGKAMHMIKIRFFSLKHWASSKSIMAHFTTTSKWISVQFSRISSLWTLHQVLGFIESQYFLGVPHLWYWCINSIISSSSCRIIMGCPKVHIRDAKSKQNYTLSSSYKKTDFVFFMTFLNRLACRKWSWTNEKPYAEKSHL